MMETRVAPISERTRFSSGSSCAIHMRSILEFLKHRVSKQKIRFTESGFDLDLTYIKPNIVAMGFPSENLEGVYRNHIEEVIRFLETRHKDHYKVYNLCSERHYDPAKFQNRVATYPFDDHNAPPFELIRPFCDDVDLFLKEDEENVAFIHCKAGKGRTGVMICSYLLHNNHFSESTEALKYYGDARTRNAKGVTIPSQRRYVLYYNHLLRHQLKYTRTMVLLKSFEMSPAPSFQNTTCNPFYIIWQQKVKLYQSKTNEGKKTSEGFAFDLTQPIPICGDVKVEFFHKDVFKKERMFQFWFNTFFVSQAAVTKEIFEDEPTLKTLELDSNLRSFSIGKDHLDKAHKDSKEKIFPADFMVHVKYSEADLGTPSRSSLPRIPSNPELTIIHRKTNSMDSLEDGIDNYKGEEKTVTKMPSRMDTRSLNYASLPRTGMKPTHRKTHSMDSFVDSIEKSYQDQEEEDNFSDSDTEEEWKKEATLLQGPQTTYV